MTTYMFTAKMRRTEEDWFVEQLTVPRLVEVPEIVGPLVRSKTVVIDAAELRDLMRKCGQVVIG